MIIVEDEVLETKNQVVRYIPKVVPEVENLVLVPTQPKKSTKLRTTTLGPVHEKLQDPRKFYCNRCPSVHRRKDETRTTQNMELFETGPRIYLRKVQ